MVRKNQTLQIVVNGLSMTKRQDGQWDCEDLKQIPANAEVIISAKQEMLEQQIQQFVEQVSGAFRYNTSDDVSDEEKKEKAQKRLIELLPPILEQMNALAPFERMLAYANHDWWYDKLHVTDYVVPNSSGNDAQKVFRTFAAEEILIPALPEQIRSSIDGYELINTAVRGKDFALYFTDNDNDSRKIITTTQLYELRNVYGYNYLDIQYNGKPLTRSCTRHYGESRAFFDGTRLMTHRAFSTCAPAANMLPDGYMVNSRRCTMINGEVYQLINSDDQLAYSNGINCLFDRMTLSYSSNDIVAARASNSAAASKLEIQDGVVTYEGKVLKPLGIFRDSAFTITEEGYMLFEPAQYLENNVYRYDHIMVVDDNSEWINTVQNAFGSSLEKGVHLYQTQDKFQAAKDILRVNPEVVLLDMHLTEHEEFDGLYVARELAKQEFKGQVWICSSYGEETLENFLRLLAGAAKHAPGKNIEKIDTLLRKG